MQTHDELIFSFLIAELNDIITSFYHVYHTGNSEQYYQLIDSILLCINNSLQDEYIEPLNKDERLWVVQEIQNLLESFDRF